jgi:FkbM family methyltransferase
MGTVRERAEAALREAVFSALARYRWPAVAAYYLRKAADQQIRHRFVGTYDPARNGEYWFLDHVGPQLGTVFDVGANMGDWTRAVLARSPKLQHIWCWEPGSEALGTLENRFGDSEAVSVIPRAVADRSDGAREFFEKPNETQVGSLFLGGDGADAISQKVEVVTIDEEISRLGLRAVDLMKVDAEGADFLVLQGARGSLCAQIIKLVQFEYHRPWLSAGATLHAALNFLTTCGYDTYLLNGDGLCRFDASRAPEIFHYMNFVAVARSHRDYVSFDVQPDPLWG